MKFDGWPWKTIGNLFCATSSLVHHFVAIGELKVELESGNAQSGSNLGHLFYAASSCVHDFIAICEFKLELESGNG